MTFHDAMRQAWSVAWPPEVWAFETSVKTGLITGMAGQDGSYLAELLLDKEYRVVGTVKNVKTALASLPPTVANNVELIELDLLDQHAIAEVLSRYRPTELYNCAAYSSGAGMFDNPVAIGDLNGLAVARMLEAIREFDSPIRICQASSSEIFGDTTDSPQSEGSPFRPRSPYGSAKLYAHSILQVYRQHYGVFACSAILFNHESPRRDNRFVTRKITQGAARIKLGLSHELRLGNLESRRDWGFAGDYVRAMWMMLQHSSGDDYIVATGETHSVRDLCELAFSFLGLDYREYVREDPGVHRPTESVTLVGNARKAQQILCWYPEVKFEDMVKNMVLSDLRILQEKSGAS